MSDEGMSPHTIICNRSCEEEEMKSKEVKLDDKENMIGHLSLPKDRTDEYTQSNPMLCDMNARSMKYLVEALEALKEADAQTDSDEVLTLCDHAAALIRRALRIEGG
jgi:hypothetical protein